MIIKRKTTIERRNTSMVVVKNILKDGTVVDDISKVTVPKEIAEKIVAVLMRYENINGSSRKNEGDS